MTSKQALAIAKKSSNEEFNIQKSQIDRTTIAGSFHFIVDGERFAYCNEGISGGPIKTSVCKIPKNNFYANKFYAIMIR